jgi:hypothetical protein
MRHIHSNDSDARNVVLLYLELCLLSSELGSQADSCVLSYGPLNAQQVLRSLGALHYSKAVFTKSNSQC